MRRILIHAGRHKTGTSSLQRFFAVNRAALRRCGYYYPEAAIRGYGHHLIPEEIVARGREAKVAELESMNELRAELANVAESEILLSSEAFQNIRPEVLRRVFHDFDVRVVFYVREQLSYLVSAYKQRIQARNERRTIEQYYRDSFSKQSDYRSFLGAWGAVFGSDLAVACYDREAMRGGDIIADFCTRFLGLDELQLRQEFEIPVTDRNPGISRKLVVMKRGLNRCITDDSVVPYGVLHGFVGSLSQGSKADPLLLDRDLAQVVMDAHRESNAFVEERYLGPGEHLSFRTDQIAPEGYVPEDVSLQEFLEFAASAVASIPALGGIPFDSAEVTLEASERLPGSRMGAHASARGVTSPAGTAKGSFRRLLRELLDVGRLQRRV